MEKGGERGLFVKSGRSLALDALESFSVCSLRLTQRGYLHWFHVLRIGEEEMGWEGGERRGGLRVKSGQSLAPDALESFSVCFLRLAQRGYLHWFHAPRIGKEEMG